MVLIEGKKIADQIQLELKAKIAGLSGRKPCLAVIQVGSHPASDIYISRKMAACSEAGISSIRKQLHVHVSEVELLAEIELLNSDPDVDAILVQLPLPKQINAAVVTQHISPDKDVDGFHPLNVGKMLIGAQDIFFPCTPLAVNTLLNRYAIEVAGRHVVIFGRSNIVGKPMAAMLMQRTPGGNATVTIAHRHSQKIEALARQADILIVAVGQPKFITAEMVKPGAVVIDVGINKIDDPTRSCGYKIVGDVDFENVKERCSYITPVPGGVGPMTIAMLLSNTFLSYCRHRSIP